MSYLNALASSGLTVGLRLLNNIQRPSASGAAQETVQEAAPPVACAQREASCPAAESRPARPAAAPLSPEERAAGQAEARAQLTAEGVLGLLQSGLAATEAAAPEEGAEDEEGAAEPQAEDAAEGSGEAQGPLKKLTPQEEDEVRKLAQRDREVKAHEQAHVAAGGGLAGSPSYEYQTGPDGRQYAVGGEVSISRGGGSSSTEQALRDAETVKRAAMAPAQPSSQDLAVAARADADIQRLRAKKAEEAREEMGGQGEDQADAQGAGQVAGGSAGAGPVQNQTPANGADLSSQVAGAYAAVKLGFQNSVRPLLARA